MENSVKQKGKKDYARSFKSVALMGGVEGVSLLIGMVQIKFIAVLIGPIGIGLNGTLGSIIEIIKEISGLGIGSSTIRDIAQANKSGDEIKLGKTVKTANRLSFLTGVTGALFALSMSYPISMWTFNSYEYAPYLMILAPAILIRSMYRAELALINGQRRIEDLSKVKINGAIISSIFAITFYYFLGIKGIVPAILCSSLANYFFSHIYSRKINIAKVNLSWKESFEQGRGMVKLGLAFMWMALLTLITVYLTRIMIIGVLSLAAVGIYQSAYRLSQKYVVFIVRALRVDFFPKLSEKVDNMKEMTQDINRQIEISILLTLPILLGLVIFSPIAINIFYTKEFVEASTLINWFCLGLYLRLAVWPIGTIFQAKGDGRLMFLTETSFSVIHIISIYFGIVEFGIVGTGIAYLLAYLFYSVLLVLLTHHKAGFYFQARTIRIISITALIILIAFFLAVFSSPIFRYSLGMLLCLLTTYFSLVSVSKQLPVDNRLNVILKKLHLIK